MPKFPMYLARCLTSTNFRHLKTVLGKRQKFSVTSSRSHVTITSGFLRCICNLFCFVLQEVDTSSDIFIYFDEKVKISKCEVTLDDVTPAEGLSSNKRFAVRLILHKCWSKLLFILMSLMRVPVIPVSKF